VGKKDEKRDTREGREEEIEAVKKGTERAIEELKSGWRITNPGHYLAGRD
jgi:hypothetical protein